MMERANEKTLQGWKEISNYLGVSMRTAQLWEKARGLPVFRIGKSKLGAVAAKASDLDEWIEGRTVILPSTGSESGIQVRIQNSEGEKLYARVFKSSTRWSQLISSEPGISVLVFVEEE